MAVELLGFFSEDIPLGVEENVLYRWVGLEISNMEFHDFDLKVPF